MADNNLLDMLGGGYLKRLASGLGNPGGGTKSDSNYVPAQPSDAQRNADYAAKRLGTQKAAAPAPAASPLATPMGSTAKGTSTKGKQ